MLWRLSDPGEPVACHLADRHYSRKTPGATLMMPPGRSIVLMTTDNSAVWGLSYPRYTLDGWDAWRCTIFRNESEHLSSTLITSALAACIALWGPPPPQGTITHIDTGKVRRKRDPGRCFLRAGFSPAGHTKDRGLLILHLPADQHPEPVAPLGCQLSLF